MADADEEAVGRSSGGDESPSVVEVHVMSDEVKNEQVEPAEAQEPVQEAVQEPERRERRRREPQRQDQVEQERQEMFPWEAIHEVREESKARRLKIEALEAQLNEIKKENETLREQLNQVVIGSAVERALESAGAIAADVIIQAGLIPFHELELDAQGRPIPDKLAERVGKLKESRPELFMAPRQKVGDIDAAARGDAPVQIDFRSMPKEDFEKVVQRVKSGAKTT